MVRVDMHSCLFPVYCRSYAHSAWSNASLSSHQPAEALMVPRTDLLVASSYPHRLLRAPSVPSWWQPMWTPCCRQS
jgi:hypothetical protein